MEEEEIYPVFDGKKVHKESYIIDGNLEMIPTEAEVVKQLVRFSKVINLEAGATLSLIYITGSRVGEIVKYKYTGVKEKEIELYKRPFCFGDIRLRNEPEAENPDNIITWVQFPTRVQKNFKASKDMTIEERRKKLQNEKIKVIRIPYIKEHPLFPLLQVIEEYMDSFIKKEGDEERHKFTPFWGHSKRRLQAIAKRFLGINIHWLRHWRSIHLVQNYGYSVQDLIHTMKWASSDMAIRYSQSRDSVVDKKQLGIIKEDIF